MTESEWLQCSTPEPLLEFSRPRLNERKLRLFACACCRHIMHLLTDDGSRAAVDVAERFADGNASRQELEAAWQGATTVAQLAEPEQRYAALAAVSCAALGNLFSAAGAVCSAASAAVRTAAEDERAATRLWHAERKGQAALLRDLVRNPFLPDTLPLRLPPTAGEMAEAMYAGQDRSEDLYELLMDERNRELALHFKSPGHLKGCWAIDFILRRSQATP